MFNPLGAGFRWAVEIPELRAGREPASSSAPDSAGWRACWPRARRAQGRSSSPGSRADARKLELAREFGADHVIDVEQEDAKKRIRALTNGRGADVVLDVSSYALDPVAASLDYVATGGRIVLAGVKGFKPVPEFISDKIVMKEIRISGAIGVTSSAYRNAIRLLESQRTPIAKMHTHDFPLDQAELAIKTLAREIPGDESIHSCLVPEH